MALSKMESSLQSKLIGYWMLVYWMIKLVGLIELIDLVYAQDIRRRAEVIFSIY